MPLAFRRTVQGAILALGLLTTTIALLLLANVSSGKCAQAALSARFGCFLVEFQELVSGLLALDGVLFAAWIAWVAVQQQIKSSERDRDLQQRATWQDQSIALQNEIAELKAMTNWAQLIFKSLDKTVPGGNVVSYGKSITADQTRREVISLDNIGSFALRSNLMGVGAAFNACFASFHQLAENFRKPHLSGDEMDELFMASRGNLARLYDWLKEIQKLIDEKQQRHKTLADQITSLSEKWREK